MLRHCSIIVNDELFFYQYPDVGCEDEVEFQDEARTSFINTYNDAITFFIAKHPEINPNEYTLGKKDMPEFYKYLNVFASQYGVSMTTFTKIVYRQWTF